MVIHPNQALHERPPTVFMLRQKLPVCRHGKNLPMPSVGSNEAVRAAEWHRLPQGRDRKRRDTSSGSHLLPPGLLCSWDHIRC